MNSKNKKRIRWGIIATILLIITYFLFIKSPKMTIEANTDVVVRETIVNKVSATGTVKPIQQVNVGTQVSGIIEKLFVDFNDHVKAGQVIALMDTRNLIAAVKDTETALNKAQVQLTQAKRTLDRTIELYRKKVVAKVDLENAENEHQMALANYNSTKLALERNQVNLDYATIRSPIDGIVISRKVDEGQTVAASFSTPDMFVIANDLKKMKIEASIDEADIGQVELGQMVEFTVDAFPEEVFHGVVEQIQLEPVTLQNVVTYTVEILVENPDLKLIPGITANLEIIVTQEEDVLAVANNVLTFKMTEDLARQIEKAEGEVQYLESNEGTSIWKKEDNIFTEIPASFGYSNGIKTEIKADVKEGDEIVGDVEILIGKKKKPKGLFSGG